MSPPAELTEILSLQALEWPVIRHQHNVFTYRYAYARSRDSRLADEIGQDFLAIREDGQRLAFGLCDGVGQSFFGDLAARLLGEALLDWFWDQSNSASDEGAFKSRLFTVLQAQTGPVTTQVLAQAIPAEANAMLRSVLEEKRALGSQTTFIAGLLDPADNRLLLAWMGDSRLRLWRTPNEEITQQLGNTFQTAERWSSLKGPLGELHTKIISLSSDFCLAVYSDGLSRLDSAPAQRMSDRAIQEYILMSGESPTTDDISLLQIWLGAPAPVDLALPAPNTRLVEQGGNLWLDWKPIASANAYEIKGLPEPIRRLGAKKPPIKIPDEWRSVPYSTMQVRAWCGYEPGEWSFTQPLPPLPAPPPTPPAQVQSQANLPAATVASVAGPIDMQGIASTPSTGVVPPRVIELPDEAASQTTARPARQRLSRFWLWLILGLAGVSLVTLIWMAWVMGVFPGGGPAITSTATSLSSATFIPLPTGFTVTVRPTITPSLTSTTTKVPTVSAIASKTRLPTATPTPTRSSTATSTATNTATLTLTKTNTPKPPILNTSPATGRKE